MRPHRHPLVAAVLVLLAPRLVVSPSARVRVVSFVELSARACEQGHTSYVGPDGKNHNCGPPTEHPPNRNCKCTPYKPSYLELTATVDGTAMPSAQYARPTAYQPVTLQPTHNATCKVEATKWNGTDETTDPSKPAPVVVETSLVLKAGVDYSLLLVGYLDRESYRPESGEAVPGKFGELYAVLLEDAAPPPRSHMGTVRLINVSPATSLLLGRIANNGRKLMEFSSDGTPYVCRRPDQCEDTHSRSCVPVVVEQAFPPGPPPPFATCNPKHRDPETKAYEGCPGFDPATHKPYSCRDPGLMESCQRNPPFFCDVPWNPENCWPDWEQGNQTKCGDKQCPMTRASGCQKHGDKCAITRFSVCQRCKCQYREIVSDPHEPLKLSDEESYCNMNPGTPGHDDAQPTPCPGKPTHRDGVWRPEDPNDPDQATIACEDCITDERSWDDKCYACPCPTGEAPPPPASCGPWANPTKSSHGRPRQDKAYLIAQKKYDGFTQTPTVAIGIEEVPFVDVPAGAHTIELFDGKYPYPTHSPLRTDVNVPVGKSLSVFLHGLPPSKTRYPNGHPASPLSLHITTDDTAYTFARVKIASTLGVHVAVGGNQTVGSATVPLRLRLGNGRAGSEVNVAPDSIELLRRDGPTYGSTSSDGEWGSYAHYEIGWQPVGSGPMRAVELDTHQGPDSVYLVLSGDQTDPKLNSYANPTLPLIEELRGKSAVRVINAAHGVTSLDVQATKHAGATPEQVASSVAVDASSNEYKTIPAGIYQLEASSSGGDGLKGTLNGVYLYEGLIYTVVVGSDSKKLDLLLSLDRSYNSRANVMARCAYLGGEPARGSRESAPPAQIKWSVSGTGVEAPVHNPVAQGEVSPYTAVALAGTYDDHFKAFRVYMRISVMWADIYSSPKEIECFTQLLPLDMEADNNTRWTFVVWGSESGRTCNVVTDSIHARDPLVLPDPSKAGLRVIAGGANRPSFRAVLHNANGADTVAVQSQTSNLGSAYTAVPMSIEHISLAGLADQIPCEGKFVAGSLHSLFVRYAQRDNRKPSSTKLVDDFTYGDHVSVKLRFLNALSSGPPVALTLQHGKENLPLRNPVVESPLRAGSLHRTQPVAASYFATPGIWLQAWRDNEQSLAKISLGTKPAEQIKPNTCPPHCPLAEGTSIVAQSSNAPQTVILSNDTTSSAPPFLVVVEDDDAAPKLCHARLRLISLLSSTVSATAELGTLPKITFSSPGISPTASSSRPPSQELPEGHWAFTIDGSTKCNLNLLGGRSYSLYVTSATADTDGKPIYSCILETDWSYDDLGYVRLAHAAGSRDTYSMTLDYHAADVDARSCKAVQDLPTSKSIEFGEQTRYTPVTVYGTTTYQVTVQQTDSSPVASPAQINVDLTAGKNWTIYVLSPRESASVELRVVEDGTTSSWSGGSDEVGLRLLDGLPEDSASSTAWSWKHCDEIDDPCVKGEGTLAPVGDQSSRYRTAKIHGYYSLPPIRNWRIGLQVARGAEKPVMQEFGLGYKQIMSCEDVTTAVPLTSGSLYTVVLTEAGGTRNNQELLMFQDRPGEPHSWWSVYGLLVILLVLLSVVVLASLAACATKCSANSMWAIKLNRCRDWCITSWCGRLCGCGRSDPEVDSELGGGSE